MTYKLQLNATEYPIHSVTVFKSSKAEIVRTFTLSLKASQGGQNKVEIDHLSSSIAVESARVSGLGDAQLFDVVCAVDNNSGNHSPESHREKLRILSSKKTSLKRELDVFKYLFSDLNNYSRGLKGDHVAPDLAMAFFTDYHGKASWIMKEESRLEEEIAQVEKESEKIRRDWSLKKGEVNGKVTVVIMAKQPTNIKLKLTYISGVPASAMSLHYRAKISQSTGEDWSDVALALSTAHMNLAGDTIPELKPRRICPPLSVPVPHPVMMHMISRPRRHALSMEHDDIDTPILASDESSLFSVSRDGRDQTSEHPPVLTEVSSVVNQTPLSLSYQVEGKSSIPSDGVAHQVSVARLPFEATVVYIVVPTVKPIAYLQANVKNSSDYFLMPGSVNVYLDDSFVSKTYIKACHLNNADPPTFLMQGLVWQQDIAPGDAFDCTLGPDASTRIIYSRSSKLDTAPATAFSEQFNTTTYTSLTTVHNRHAFALSTLIIRDTLPISEDEQRVRVILREPGVLATTGKFEEKSVETEDGEAHKIRWYNGANEDGDKKEGLYEWVCSVDAGKKVTVRAVWDIKAPADVKWVETS
ncbi:hypothetical protein OF83DRAFT_1163099 [Amylostereum chailletii]|nr:hypothetical protein OF83DRAFT_1163099 [Amylostereum chailletii]